MSPVRPSRIRPLNIERSNGMRLLVIGALKFYRNYLSILNLRCCRFYPSCSQYAIESIEKHGLLLGVIKSTWRVLRCNPFSRGGYDPVRPYSDSPSDIKRSNGTIR